MIVFYSAPVTQDQYAVGDITGRHHDLPDAFTDHNLPLQGVNSVYGKVVRVRLLGGASVCAVIRKDSVKLGDDNPGMFGNSIYELNIGVYAGCINPSQTLLE